MLRVIKTWPDLVNDFNVKNNCDVLNDIVIDKRNELAPNIQNKKIALLLGAQLQLNRIGFQVYFDQQNGVIENENLKNAILSYQETPQGRVIFKECQRLNNAYYHRYKRLRLRIKNILQNEGTKLFLTLTFTNDVLAKTSDKTRRRYVSRFLKEHCKMYVANIDFGAKNEREHYHAVVLTKNAKLDATLWPYGTINLQVVKINDNVDKRLSKYVSKLTNHALKETTKRSYVIYSKIEYMPVKNI